MPLNIPTLDDRTYQDLLKEALARISIHNPEWTNYNESDPGITLIELFAFLTENLLYRANQIPERNRRAFLSLLNIPLQPAFPARGLVTISNERGPLQTVTFNDDLEVRAGQVPFRTDTMLDVLPIEARVYFKRRLDDPSGKLLAYYNQLYASYKGQPPETAPMLYETVPFSPTIMNNGGVNLGTDTVDNALWVALLVRATDQPGSIEEVRRAIAGKTISLGIVPVLSNATQHFSPLGQSNASSHLYYALPNVPPGGRLPDDAAFRVPHYLSLDVDTSGDVLAEPGVAKITLPAEAEKLRLWSNLDPLEAGVGDFPPTLDDTNVQIRLITWLRISTPPTLQVKLLWLGINTVSITQQAYIANELLPRGTGEPDQSMTLARTSIMEDSVQLTITMPDGQNEQWYPIDTLLAAGPEVNVSSSRLPPGTQSPSVAASKVFQLDAESGVMRFGDGMHGARPPFQATLRVDYAYNLGADGNVGAGSISSGSALPGGFTVRNPVRTWGGAAPESVSEAERHIARYLHHRDRLVSISDFETITMRTPGVSVGRVEVIPAYNPALAPNAPGDMPGAVTLMVLPSSDQDHPNTPVPDRLFLDTIAAYLDPRRLVTTEIFLRGPSYKPLWVSVGLKGVPGANMARVRENVRAALISYLSPLPLSPEAVLDSQGERLIAPHFAQAQRGWPLRKPVIDLELLAIASRVEGVLLVTNILLAEGLGPGVRQIPMNGLELPQLVGLNVTIGEPLDLDQIRGQGGTSGEGGAGTARTANPFVPIPAPPEEHN